jgi:glycosyltransferase involved in cell wall biosynthesis
MPPEASGIADYSALLLPALRRHVDVVVVKRGTKRPPRDVDLAVYHIGNNPEAHDWILDALRRAPGLVVLHDFVLHHLVAGVTIGRRDGNGYLDAMEREHGVVGRLLAHGVLDKRIPPLWESRPEDFPLAGDVLALATGLVVHSHYVEQRVRAAGYAGPVAVVPHPAWPDPRVEPAAVEGAPLIGAFGNVNQSKRVPQLLEAFARLRTTHPDARLLLVGATSPGFDLDRRLQRLGLEGEGVVREGHVDEVRLWSLMAACDVHASLRSPTMGETSGTAIRALVLGKPLVVSDVGWFSELPADVALAVPVGETETAELTAALRLLAERPDVREAMGEAGRALAVSAHDLDRVAELQAAAFERTAGGAAVDAGVLHEVSDAAAAIGVAPGSPEASEIARRLSELGLGGAVGWASGRPGSRTPPGSRGSSASRSSRASGSSGRCPPRSSSSTSSSTPSWRRASWTPAPSPSGASRCTATASSTRRSSPLRTGCSTPSRAHTQRRRRRTRSRCPSPPSRRGCSRDGSSGGGWRSSPRGSRLPCRRWPIPRRS